MEFPPGLQGLQAVRDNSHVQYPHRVNLAIDPYVDPWMTPAFMHRKHSAFAKFSGTNTNIRCRTWLNLYEASTYNLTDQQRIAGLITSLDEDALEWFGTEIAQHISHYPWSRVRELMTQRFEERVVMPIVAAQDLKLAWGTTVQSYYNQKMRLLRQSSASEAEMAALLTRGMPNSYLTTLIGARLTNPQDWLSVALQIEASLAQQRKPRQPDNRQSEFLRPQQTQPKVFTSSTSSADSDKGKKKSKEPPGPCRHCTALGLTEMHWNKHCPNRPHQQSTNTDGQSSTKTTTLVVTVKEPSCNVVDHHQQAISITQTPRKGFIALTVKINRREVRTFMDTGSDISIMSDRLRRALNLLLTPNSSITIQGVEGPVTSVGLTYFNLTVGHLTKVMKAHVLMNFDYNLLLGLDVGDEFDLYLAVKKRQATVGPPNLNNHVLTAKAADGSLTTVTLPSPFAELITEYQDIFSKDDLDVGKIPLAEHQIITTNSRPHSFPPRRHPKPVSDTLRQLIEDYLKKGFIRISTSPYAYPVSLQRKKDGSPRLCVDYRRLNEETIDEKHPLPQIQLVHDRLQGARFFSVMDVSWGYWHVRLAKNSIEKTAFVTEDGHYEWLVMPFGLKNAPSTFQRILRNILGEYSFRFVINYLDDIIVYSRTLADHQQHLRLVFDKIRQHNIRLKLRKCVFASYKVEYLGSIIQNDTISPNPSKIQAVSEFPEPKTRKEVQRFLGLTGYFRNFIPSYTEIAHPLQKLTKWLASKSVTLDFDAKASFHKLKKALVNPPVLNIFNPDLDTEVHTDASKVGIGAILIQRSAMGFPLAIAFFSKRVGPEQENWSATDLESLAIMESVERWDTYLRYKRFKVFTDHSALQFLNSPRLKGRLYRWRLRLLPYSIDIYYRKGKLQKHVDALSRAPVEPPSQTWDPEPSPGIIVDHRSPACLLSTSNRPSPITKADLIKAQEDEDTSFLKKPIIKDGLLHVKRKGVTRVYIPKTLRPTTLYFYHEGFGHPGVTKTKQLIKTLYWWPNMAKEIEDHIARCDPCQRIKIPTGPKPGELQLMPSPPRPMMVLGMDTIVMGGSASDTAAKYVQVIIDHHSRHVWAFPTKSNTASAAITSLKSVIQAVKPDSDCTLITDQGTNFMSKAFKNFAKANNIVHQRTSAYHPQSNGMTEKVNGLLVTRLRLAQDKYPNLKWSSLIQNVCDEYNDTPHGTTGYTPAFLMFGRYPPSTVPYPEANLTDARKTAQEKTIAAQLKRKQEYDRKHSSVTFNVGQKVVRRIPLNHPDLDKLSPRQTGPHTIIEKVGPVNYRIERYVGDNHPPVVHASQLWPYNEHETLSLQASLLSYAGESEAPITHDGIIDRPLPATDHNRPQPTTADHPQPSTTTRNCQPWPATDRMPPATIDCGPQPSTAARNRSQPPAADHYRLLTDHLSCP